MKKAAAYLLLVFFTTSLSFAQTGAILKFKKSKLRFGFVHEGDTVKLTYHFENAGSAPLLISEIKVTCGCTVADFPKTPLLPGQKGVILVRFDTHDKYDRQDRTIEVISNAETGVYKLRFKGVVLKPKLHQ